MMIIVVRPELLPAVGNNAARNFEVYNAVKISYA